MRKAFTTITATAAVVALALSGCAETATLETGGDAMGATDIRGEWTLVAGTVDGESIELSPFPITMEFIGDNARVRTGCYSFDQPLSDDLEVMTLASLSQPVASCMALSESETAAMESLDDLTGADRTGDFLTLTGDAVELEFELVRAVALGEIEGTWMLGAITWGDVAVGFEKSPALVIAADGTFSGSTGCADFSGTLGEIVSGTNTLESLTIGESTCPDEPTSGEQDVRDVLEGGFLIHMRDGDLSMVSSTSETTLVYSPAA